MEKTHHTEDEFLFLLNNIDLLKATLDSSKNRTEVLKAIRDEEGNIVDFEWVFVNKLGEYMLGDVVGKRFSLYNRYPEYLRLYIQTVETGIPLTFEEIRQVNGQMKWYDINLTKLRDGVVVKGLDITERKEAEIHLKKNNQLLQSVFDTSLVGLSVLEAVRDESQHIQDFRIKMMNKEMERALGRTDVVGKLYGEEYPEIRKWGIFQTMLNIMETGIPEQMEYQDKHSGANRWFSCMFVKMDDGLVITNLDITQQKLAEEKNREDDALLRGMIEAAPDMVYVINITAMQMVYVNQKIASLFQRSLEEIRTLGASLFDQVVYPEDRRKFDTNIEQLRQAKSDGEVRELIYRLIDGQGNIHWVKTRRTVFKRNQEGIATHILGISIDITEQLNLEQKNLQLRLERKELEKRQRQELFIATLKAQEEERKRIAENLHNGLGQLLYGIKLTLDQLDIQKASDEPGKAQWQAFKQTERLLKEAIRESRRISHELMPSILEDFGLRAAIEDICNSFNKKIGFNCTFSGPEDKLDKSIKIAIYRIVQELITNIIKHADATEASILVKFDQHSVQLTVTDNGQGFQENTDRSGIGLTTIRNKIKLLNGTFNIHSVRGNGSTVSIHFPNKQD